jgi:hypothetical protein
MSAVSRQRVGHEQDVTDAVRPVTRSPTRATGVSGQRSARGTGDVAVDLRVGRHGLADEHAGLGDVGYRRQHEQRGGIDALERAVAPPSRRSITADQVVTVLERVTAKRGAPVYLRCDNGTELTAHALTDWCQFTATSTSYIDRGHRGRTRSWSPSTAESATNS